MALELRKFKEQAVFVGVQSAMGTPATVFNFLSVESGQLDAEAAAKIELKDIQPSYSKQGMINVGAKYSGSYDLTFRPSGVDGGNIPISLAVSPLLQASGLIESTGKILNVSTSASFLVGETVQDSGSTATTGMVYGVATGKLFLKNVSGTFSTSSTVLGLDSASTSTISTVSPSLVYALNSSIGSAKYATIKHNIGGVQELATDVQCNVKITAKDSDVARINIGNILGIYSDPTTVSLGAISCPAKDPIKVNPLMVVWGAYDSTVFVVESMDVDLGNTVSEVNDAKNSSSITAVKIEDRNPKITLSMSAPQLASFNPFENANTNVKQAISFGLNLNGNAGERVMMHANAAQWEYPKKKDVKGVVYYDINGMLTGCNDNEFVLTVF